MSCQKQADKADVTRRALSISGEGNGTSQEEMDKAKSARTLTDAAPASMGNVNQQAMGLSNTGMRAAIRGQKPPGYGS